MDTQLNYSTSQGDQYPVYVGIWTNWSRGQVMGSTLTLRRRDANLLIAFTAFFIAFDAIYHQRQAVLRNSSSPESGVQMLLWLLWANRRSKGWLRPLPAATVAIACISAFTVAGGFSSQISTAVSSEVLIKSSNCGLYSLSAVSIVDDAIYFLKQSYRATKLNNAANYAQQCYSNENNGLLDCGRFITKRVTNTVDTRASCPFYNHLCRNESANLRIDSGYIDSHSIFGLNTPTDKRILFRNVLHCAPLTTTGFTDERNTSLGRLTLYRYGNYNNLNGTERSYVYAAPSVDSQYPDEEPSYSITTYGNYAIGFIPIDEMARTDADVYLVFLSGNGVLFTEPSDDLWYHTSKTPLLINLQDQGLGVPLYAPQEPASPLGCANQYQFCSTSFQGLDGCGPLASLEDAVEGVGTFFGADHKKDLTLTEAGARFLYFVRMFFTPPISDGPGILGHLGPTALTSQKTLFGAIQGRIASNQWQHDVSHWWDISMAAQQSKLLDAAYAPDNSDMNVFRINYTEPELKKLCRNQKIRSTAYASFSLFGLFFTLATGLLIILVSYLLEPIFEWLHKRKESSQYPYLEWVTNATLQLQRLAHEEVGFGTWTEGTETIPLTKAHELLGSLDITDPRHPVLRRTMTGDGVPLSAESSTKTRHTGIGDGSTMEQSNHTSDAEQEANGNPQENLADGATQTEDHEPFTNPSTVSPLDDTSNSEDPFCACSATNLEGEKDICVAEGRII
ncbi:hypothetical protein F4680DRAFT_470779 [Xylaria scruposa]|nr:hypothetical protein F4680DRAFT_470779 [Xylaria scruposa]